jgi:hypothetical protein
MTEGDDAMMRIRAAETDALHTLYLRDAFAELADALRKLGQEQPHLKKRLDCLIAVAEEGAKTAESLADASADDVDGIAARLGVCRDDRCPSE